LKGPLIGLVCSVLYTFFAAIAVKICILLRDWAYFKKNTKLDNDIKILMGTFWPIILIGCVIIYLFLGIINRLFNE